jgi:hypothetical protein
MAFVSKDPVKDLSEGVKTSTASYSWELDGNSGAHRVGNCYQADHGQGTQGYNPSSESTPPG